MITLYIKTHNETGLKYFGVTTADPHKYNGSGKHWVRHLKKHGNNVTTEIFKQFKEKSPELIETALKFSKENDIVNSKLWANLIPENGLDGGTTNCAAYINENGIVELIDVDAANERGLVAESKGRKYSDEVNKKKGKSGEKNYMFGKKHSEESKLKQGEKSKNTITCYDLEEKIMKRIPKDLFNEFKGIKFVGPTSLLAKEYYENKEN
jgi:hypothetical protein